MTEKINKDLILREKLALQRITLANQTTVLSFLRTAMYFSVAGLSTRNVLKIENGVIIEYSFYFVGFIILVLGLINFLKHQKLILENRKHIGNFKLEYQEQ